MLMLVLLLCACTDSHESGINTAGASSSPNTATAAETGVHAARDSELAPRARAVYSTRYGKAEFYSQIIGSIGVFTGESNNLNGTVDLEAGTLDFHLPLTSLRTGIEQRDTDMYKLLGVDQNPYARFTGTLETGFELQNPERQPVSADGMFFLNGREHPLRVDGFLQRDGDGIRLQATWILDMTDFGLKPPSYMLLDVSNELEISISGRLIPPVLVAMP